MRIKLYFSYDGTAYHGFQRQKNTPHTVQEKIETILRKITSEKVTITASGRTDAGVHARIQLAHCEMPEWTSRLLLDNRLRLGLNSMLPKNIRIWKIEKTNPQFHAIRDAKKKTYLYFIDQNSIQWPFLRNYAWHLRLPLDWDAVHKATPLLIGRHDFKAFCSAGSSAKTTVRTIEEAYWDVIDSPFGPLHVFRITSQGFLKQMVRNIVGTLVSVGNGKADKETILQALKTKDRKFAYHTAPAHGLWLWDILY